MRVIEPKYEIIEDQLEKLSLPERIEYCGRVCYKSEDKITRDSAIPFVSKVAELGHNSVLEMGSITLCVSINKNFVDAVLNSFLQCEPKYLVIDKVGRECFYITGSVRAFREMIQNHPANELVSSIYAHLKLLGDWFCVGLEGVYPVESSIISIRFVPKEELMTKDSEIIERHLKVAVKFTVNRAVTHEIVRHRPCSYLQESQRYCRYDKGQFGGQVTFIKPMFFAENTVEYSMWKEACKEAERVYLELLDRGVSAQAARTVLPNSCKTELIVYCNLAEWKHIFKLRTSKAAEPSMREVMIPLQEEFKLRWPDIFTN